MQDLALKIGCVHHVHVDDPQGPHSGGRQVQGRGGAEPTRPQQEDLRVEEPELPDLADLGEKEVTLVAISLLGSERLRRRPVPALVLPPVEPPDQRGHVRVAQLLERLGGERRASPHRAVDHHVARLVGDPALDRGLEGASRDVHGVGQCSLPVLVGLSHVEDDRVAGGDLLFGLGRLDLSNGRLGFGQHLPEGRHDDHDPFSMASDSGSDRSGAPVDRRLNTTSGVNIPTVIDGAGHRPNCADSLRIMERPWS